MKTKNLILLLISVLIISCGNPMNPPKNDNKIGKVIITDANKTYEVRMGSIVTNIKPSEMTNEWISYIGGKKVNHFFFNRYFEKGTGNYREDDFSKDKPRAKCYGATICSNNDTLYLMGVYYNYDTKGMPNNWMLIYIQSNGQERGYYGGGTNENKKPDSSTVWTHYKSPVDPLGRLTEY
ncbi:hypothetical protein [uncultured Brachyspira sp.]|uniref:hypothetical protein n=1 Tax=uncultured Brachyspira sp. TaxID=221953 RepID=UPI002597B76D|nr:hypothetical protein [uncultured Brachyspira sp.]